MCVGALARAMAARQTASGRTKINPDEAVFNVQLGVVIAALFCITMAGVVLVFVENVAAGAAVAAVFLLCAMTLLLGFCGEACCQCSAMRWLLPTRLRHATYGLEYITQPNEDDGVELTSTGAVAPLDGFTTSHSSTDASASVAVAAAAAVFPSDQNNKTSP